MSKGENPKKGYSTHTAYKLMFAMIMANELIQRGELLVF